TICWPRSLSRARAESSASGSLDRIDGSTRSTVGAGLGGGGLRGAGRTGSTGAGSEAGRGPKISWSAGSLTARVSAALAGSSGATHTRFGQLATHYNAGRSPVQEECHLFAHGST